MVKIPPPALAPPPVGPFKVSDALSKEEGNTSVGRTSTIESLPDDLLIDILARVPAHDLHERARVVCHKWCHIIQSDAFIKIHLHHSTHGLVLCPIYSMQGDAVLLSATQGRIETSRLSKFVTTWTRSSCNGLALESCIGKAFPYIANHARKRGLHLPSLPDRETAFPRRCGIAYSSVSKSYKVILLLKDSHTQPLRQLRLHILTVGVDRSWREIEIQHLPENLQFLMYRPPLSTGGFLHWGVDGKAKNEVLTLDVERESLRCSHPPLPGAYRCKYYLPTPGSLSMIVVREDLSWDVWEMKPETGDWRLLRPNINPERPRSQYLRPVGWVKYPKVLALCFSFRSCTCIFYDLDTHEISWTDLCFPVQESITFMHVESLVWLGSLA